MADDGSNGDGGNGGESGSYVSGSGLGLSDGSGQGGYDGVGSSGSSGENIDPGILVSSDADYKNPDPGISVSPDYGGWKPENSDCSSRNWDMSKGYMNYSTARLNQWVWGQMAAAGLGPDPVSKTSGVNSKAAPPADGPPSTEQQPQASANQEAEPNKLQVGGDANQPQNTEKAKALEQKVEPKDTSLSTDERQRAQGSDPDAIRYDDQGNSWTERQLARKDDFKIFKGVPPGAVLYRTPDGQTFYAPPWH